MLRRLCAALILMTMVLAGSASDARAAGRVVCDKYYDKVSRSWVEFNCRWVEDRKSDDGDGGNGPSVPRGTPMMWIRFGVYSAGDGYVGENCRLWPMGEALPPNHNRVTAEDCGIEGSEPSRADVERMVHNLSASLKVPAPTIQLGPEPSVNEWNMSVVGLPIWLWTDTPRSASSTNSGSGMTININATLDKLSFDMGDGKTVTCNTWTPYTSALAGDPSPTCGHTYSRPSLPKGEYTINATATWTAQWSAMGYTGTLPLRSTATRQLPVGELQAVVVRNR